MSTRQQIQIDERQLMFSAGTVELPGILRLPEQPRGVVLFAHGTGSNRFSKRNTYVANALHRAGFGSFLFDLLGRDESHDQPIAADMQRLAERMQQAVDELRGQEQLENLPFGYYGASTGAAVCLIAAAGEPEHVRAIVSRGGRTDLAADSLADVQAPTLLIAGGRDAPVMEINRESKPLFQCRTELAVVADASHLFEEPGALDEVARRTTSWFERFVPLNETG